MGEINKKILVIEDDAGIRESLQEVFASEGYEVLLAEDGKRGLEILRDQKPFLILLDLMMPVMDGSAFLADLEQEGDQRLASTPVVVLTAAGVRSTSRCKAHEILTKPIDIDALLNVAAKYCA